jgi:hypothetical protein
MVEIFFPLHTVEIEQLLLFSLTFIQAFFKTVFYTFRKYTLTLFKE